MSRKNIEKITPKIDFRSHFGLHKPRQTPPKSTKKTSKNDVEKKLEKNSVQDPQKKPVLVRNGKREDI